jgi:hypothetical protein
MRVSKGWQIVIDEKQMENMECLNSWCSLITNDASCRRGIKSGIAMAIASFNKKKNLFTSKLNFNLRKKLAKCCILSIALCGAETGTLRRVDQR